MKAGNQFRAVARFGHQSNFQMCERKSKPSRGMILALYEFLTLLELSCLLGNFAKRVIFLLLPSVDAIVANFTFDLTDKACSFEKNHF